MMGYMYVIPGASSLYVIMQYQVHVDLFFKEFVDITKLTDVSEGELISYCHCAV